MSIGALLATVPWFVPGMAGTVIVSALVCRSVARRLDTDQMRAWWLLVSLGVIGVTTLTPQREALAHGVIGTGSCDLSRVWPASLDFYAGVNDSAENIGLFIPLGAVIALLPARIRLPALVAGIHLPVAIELFQRQATVLNRSCQSADVVDNLVGLGLGLVLGGALAAVAALVRMVRRDRLTEGSTR
jgi:hypothetical protein